MRDTELNRAFKHFADDVIEVMNGELDDKADLVDGKVPAAQLPSYVDDVVEYPSFSDFPSVGESGKIYLARDMNRTYRWSGSEYIPVPDYNIWKGTEAQYAQLQTDDYDLYFIVEVSS